MFEELGCVPKVRVFQIHNVQTEAIFRSKEVFSPSQPDGPKSSQFHALFWKIWQNRMLMPPRGLVPPPLGNPGSAPVRLLLSLLRSAREKGGGVGHPEPHRCLRCRQPFSLVVKALPLWYIWYYVCVCDGKIDPPCWNMVWVYRNAMKYSGQCEFSLCCVKFETIREW